MSGKISIRRSSRLRREFLYRKNMEKTQNAIQQKKDAIKRHMEVGDSIPNHLKDDTVMLMEMGLYDGEGSELAAQMAGEDIDIDDEYTTAGVTDPQVAITTSRNPSNKLKQFAKELRLLIPNSHRFNRGNFDNKQLMNACRDHNITDFVVVHETRGRADNLVISHLPNGPTAYFTLQKIVARHDIPGGVEPMSEQFPHLIFDNFTTQLGKRVQSILTHIFPPPKDESKRVISFLTENDWIFFRNHSIIKVNKQEEIKELGPRFVMKLYKILRGTLEEEKSADVEFVERPHMNTYRKRLFLSERKTKEQLEKEELYLQKVRRQKPKDKEEESKKKQNK